MIRAATHADLPELTDMAHAFFHEAEWNDIAQWDDMSATATMASMLDAPNKVLLVDETDGLLQGMIGAVIYPFWFNHNELTSQELFWYVLPTFRRGTGFKLLKALELAVKAKGAASIMMVSTATLRPEVLEFYYKKQGYRPSERTYIKRF